MPGISLRDVGMRFGSNAAPVLEGISLDIAPGEFVSVLGPSGCGKTTLLRLIDGLIAPDHGSILVNEEPPRPGAHMGVVFQSFRLMPWATVADNVGFGLDLKGVERGARDRIVAEWLERVGLSAAAQLYPAALSGGMQQRVALARALAPDPDVLLLDEPFASLDAQTREIMQLELLDLWERRKLLAVLVTHSVEEAILLADRVVVMGPAPRSIREIVPIDLPRPRLDAVRTSPAFLALRQHLTGLIRAMITEDPQSPFFKRR